MVHSNMVSELGLCFMRDRAMPPPPSPSLPSPCPPPLLALRSGSGRAILTTLDPLPPTCLASTSPPLRTKPPCAPDPAPKLASGPRRRWPEPLLSIRVALPPDAAAPSSHWFMAPKAPSSSNQLPELCLATPPLLRRAPSLLCSAPPLCSGSPPPLFLASAAPALELLPQTPS